MKGIRVVFVIIALSLVAGSRGFAAEEQSPLHLAVVEVSNENAEEWQNILNNVENLQNAFWPERTAIEVVAHDKGLGLLLNQDNALEERLRMLAERGVVLAACENTMRLRHIEKDELLPFAIIVDSGVAEIIRRQADGWAYLKGGGT